MLSYKLSAPIVGTELAPTGLHVIQIMAGELLTIPETGKTTGLVEADLHGHNITIYLQDLSERAERVNVDSQ